MKALTSEAIPGVRETLASDERIIESVLRGQTRDYRELMCRYQASAFRLAYGVLGRREEAEDATQETFIKAYDKLDTCRERSRFWPWLRRITLNTCLTRLSRERPCDNIADMPEADCSPDDPVESEIMRQVELEDIRKAIAGLPDAYRTIVVLRYQEELPYSEIADMLGETLSAVQVRLHRARKMLAKRLEVIANETR